MARATNGNYYTNPAFCQQSEFYNYQNKTLGRTQISPRKPPIGAQTSHRVLDHSVHEARNRNDSYEEQDFYEEMLVDDAGIIKEKKIVVVSQTQNEARKFLQSQQNLSKSFEVTYSSSEERAARNHRYEYIPMTEHVSPSRENRLETNGSRYAVINVDEDTESTSKGRYALVPVEELQSQHSQIQRATSRMKSTPNLHRYEYIDDMDYNDSVDLESHHSRTYSRNHISRHNSPTKTPIHSPIPRAMSPAPTRYEYIQEPVQDRYIQNYDTMTPTQKLHEILSTPKRTPVRQQIQQNMMSPGSQRRNPNIPRTPVINDPFITPKKVSPKKKTPLRNPKAQQKLNYSIGSRQMTPSKNSKNTAIIAPICASPVQSVYSETTYSNKTESWMNVSVEKPPVQATLALAALMMVVCGGLSSGMCFYIMSLIGKVYYLEFGIVSGFACLTLGVLGFRTRHCSWLPNRNYISGYIVLSVFSLLTCAALLVLLFMQPRPGTPLADMTSGAVCAISVLSLCLATTGVLSSYCCSVPPPDNRVQHCTQGFIV